MPIQQTTVCNQCGLAAPEVHEDLGSCAEALSNRLITVRLRHATESERAETVCGLCGRASPRPPGSDCVQRDCDGITIARAALLRR